MCLNTAQIQKQWIIFVYYWKCLWQGSYQNIIATLRDIQIIRSLTSYIMSYAILRICTLNIQCTSTQYRDSGLLTVLCVARSCSFISFPRVVLTEIRLPFSHFPKPYSIAVFVSNYCSFHFVSLTSSLCFFTFQFIFSLVMSWSIAFCNPVLGNDFGKSAKDDGLKIDTDIVL